MVRKIILSTFFLLLWHFASPQTFSFDGYSISDGLSQSVVNCIFQDSRGYLWIGTQNGLNRFNGYDFDIFTHNPGDSGSISNNWIYAIDEDKDGNLWIGTKSGLNKFIIKEKRFRKIPFSLPYSSHVSEYIYDVRCSVTGMILVNTPPVMCIVDPETLQSHYYKSDLPFDGGVNDNSLPLIETSDGKIWSGSNRGLSCMDPRTGKFEHYFHKHGDPSSISSNQITALHQAKNGIFYVGTTAGLHLFDQKNKRFQRVPFEKSASGRVLSSFVRAILTDPDGNIWVATEGSGIARISMINGMFITTEAFTAERNGLNHNIIHALCVDRSSNLWIGTLSGINKTDLKERKFKLYRKSDTPYSVNLSGNVIASLFKEENGILWIGTWGQGLNLYNRITDEVQKYNAGSGGRYHIPNDFVHVIFQDAGKNLWIGTRDGLMVFNRNSRSFIRPEKVFPGSGIRNLEGLRIYRMIQDRRGDYWVATQSGLYRMSKSTGEFTRFSVDLPGDRRISANLVYALLEDSRGRIWIGTVDGLDIFSPTASTITHYRKPDGLSDNFITSLCEDRSGDVWVGTNTYVNRYSRNNGKFTYYAQGHGLTGNIIYSILQDKKGNLWFATGNGLSLYDPSTDIFRTFTVEEGLQSPEFNLGASCLASDGELFFGGMDGFNSFYPDSLRDNPHLPPVVFTSAYKVSKGIKTMLDVNRDQGIVLDYNDFSFTIEFAALEFTNPAKNQYAYMLEGIDDEWIETGNRNYIAFSNLPPGQYTLRVKGSNNDGYWNESGISLPITIRPPWYRSNVAYVAYVLILIFLLFIFGKIRERNHLRARKILEERVNERTRQIEMQKQEIQEKNTELNELNASKDKFFSIIAHDLRNPFNAIIGLSEVMLMGSYDRDPKKIKSSLEHIHGSSQQAHELLENLLMWARSHTRAMAFEPEPLELKAMVEETISLVGVLAERKNIRILTKYEDCSGVTGDRNMIRTIIRNLLTNALKFTPHHGEVTVMLGALNGNCCLTVADSGVGIAPDKIKDLFSIDASHKTKGTDQEPGTGLGLILCKEFIERHGGHIEVNSELGKGSTFTVILPKR